MFVDKYTGRVKWLNLLLAKIGLIGTITLSTYFGAHNSAFVKNVETVVLHGPRVVAEGFYRGDAEIEVKVNRYGDIERYVKFVPSEEMYALGEDGYPKESCYLLDSLESRLEKTRPEEARKITERMKQIQRKYSNQ